MAQRFRLDEHKKESRIFNGRLIFSVSVVFLLVVILVSWLVNLQFVQHEYYSARSDGNRLHSQYIPPTRGLIYDRQGRLLAENRPIFNLTVVRELAEDFDQSLQLLRDEIGLTDEDIQQYQVRQDRRAVPRSSVPLKIKLDDDQIAKIAVNQHRLPGIAVEAQLLRYYPYDQGTSHSIGYVSEINREELQGMNAVSYTHLTLPTKRIV